MTELEPYVEQWAAKIRPHLAGAVEHIVAAGAELVAAKEALPHGQFGPLLKELGLTRQSANSLMRVARNPVIANRQPVGALPAAVSVLDTLTQLPDEELEAAIERGEVTASTTRQQAAAMVKQKAHEADVAARDEQRRDLTGDDRFCAVLPVGDPCGCCDSTDSDVHAAAVAFRSTCQRCRRDNANVHLGDTHLCSSCETAILSEWASESVPSPLAELDALEAMVDAGLDRLRDLAGQLEVSFDSNDALLGWWTDLTWCCGLPVHPALACIPPMTETERTGLVESVRKRGLLVPISLYRGWLVDGRERLMACQATGVEPTYRECTIDPAGLVWSLNICRQSFTPDQQAAIQVRADELREEERVTS